MLYDYVKKEGKPNLFGAKLLSIEVAKNNRIGPIIENL